LSALILLVDDYLDALDMYREYLLYCGYRVETAKNGAEALRAAASQRPDLILMDVQMPIMNGIDAMRILRSQQDFASVPIVALTAHALDDERQQMLMQGFDDVVAKPCLPSVLVEAIERLLDLKRTAT
jgi:two-component system, cell cycle response regulator DivK